MTNRLLVNPGTPQAWEIPLRPGVNRIGRGEDNDFQVNHASVSTHHCEIVVSSAGVLLKDLGSTNGTFINRAPVREALLQSGQYVLLGGVNMLFEATRVRTEDEPITIPAAAPARPTLAVRRVTLQTVAAGEPLAEPPLPPPVTASAAPTFATAEVEFETSPQLLAGAAFCKFHPKTAARFHCAQCQKYYCDMCVTTRSVGGGMGKFCRACGQTVTPVQLRPTRVGQKGFFAHLRGAVIYPFRGFGLLILILTAAFFSALEFFGGPFAIIIKIGAYGFLFLFMQNIIHSTASDENEPLSFPSAGGLFGAAFQLAATIALSFGPAIGLLIARFFEVPIPGAAIIAAAVFGCFYFPMSFLAVAMKDTVMAANPLVVIPAIFKMPFEYLVTCILLMSVFGLRQLGDLLSSVAEGVTFSTRDMSVLFLALAAQAFWAFGSLYLLTVCMRILGLLYITKKEKFGWFSR